MKIVCRTTIFCLCLFATSVCSAQEKVSFFGSSVCNGVGADGLHGYAWMIDSIWAERYVDQPVKGFYRSNISINGNNTLRLLARYDRDLLGDSSRYVVIGLGLGNEGIHGSSNPDSVYDQWRHNMQLLIRKMHKDGKIVVATNNYPRGDYDSIDFAYICRMNLEMQRWNIPTVNFLGALLNGKGDGRWPEQTVVPGDIWHPNTLGHEMMMQAFVPTLFEALRNGKPMPRFKKSRGTVVSNDEKILFYPETPIPASSTLAYILQDGVHIIVSNAMTGEDIVYINGEEKERLPHKQGTFYSFRGCWISQLVYYRAAMNEMEVKALTESLQGHAPLLTSSLELYCPLDKRNVTNYAQSANSIRFVDIDEKPGVYIRM